MKKFIGIWLVVLMSCMFTMSMNTVYAVDQIPPVVSEDVTPSVPVVDDSEAVVPAVEEVEAVEEVSSGWMHTIGTYAEMIAGILLPILYALLAALGLVIRKKWGAEAEAITEKLLTSLIDKAVNYAENWAKKQSDKPAGDKKMQVALDFLAPLIVRYNLPTMAKDKIIEEIEKHLMTTDK